MMWHHCLMILWHLCHHRHVFTCGQIGRECWRFTGTGPMHPWTVTR